MYSGNPTDDAIGHMLQENDREDLPETVRCEQDGLMHFKSDCVRDSEGACWVAKENVKNYLQNFERDMCSDEYNRLEKELKDQI